VPPLRRAGAIVLALLSPAAECMAQAAATRTAAEQVTTRALVTVRTLVIDGMGTRTVDTDTARVPFGSKGLLLKKVPYAGPPLSFRLAVLAGVPQESGLPLTITAEIWSGDVGRMPPPDGVSRREEATVVAAETSYLFEIDHDNRTDRRIVLSISARPVGEDELTPATVFGAIKPVGFLVEVVRESGGVAGEPDVHELSTMVGRQVTYSSGVRLAPRPGVEPQTIGLNVALLAEQVQGDLVTVKVELSGAEYVDEARSLIEPIRLTDVQTVSSGTRLEVHVTVPAAVADAPSRPAGIRPVTYRVSVIPTLG